MSDPGKYKLIYLARRAKPVSREEWPRTWRSHAVFASQFRNLEAKIDWLRYCNRVDEPSVDGEPIDVPALSVAHDGVAVAASDTLEGIKGGAFSKQDRELIDEDERRVFDMLTPNFTYFTKETVLKDGPLGEAALFRFLPRREGLDPDKFDRRYRREHAVRCENEIGSIAGLSRAILNHPVHEPLPLFPFDGISEFWFETSDDAVRALTVGQFDVMSGDISEFCRAEREVMMLTSVSHRWSDL